MTDVLFSYAHEDKDVVARLKYLFEREGWDCWVDTPNIPLGADFRPIIDGAIAAATLVLVLWSPASRNSTWVRLEVAAAMKAGKLLEFEIEEPAGSRRKPTISERLGWWMRTAIRREKPSVWTPRETDDGSLIIPRRCHLAPVRDEVLRYVAEAGGLTSRRMEWDAEIHVTAYRNRPPRQPVIAWEWVHPEVGEPLLIRRERWTEGATITFGTRIGHAWMFGREESCVGLGHLWVTKPVHHVQLPQVSLFPKKRPFVTCFNADVRITDDMGGVGYPTEGINLGAVPGNQGDR